MERAREFDFQIQIAFEIYVGGVSHPIHTLHPTPYTLNLQPSALNPQLSTLSSQPSALNPQPSSLSSQASGLKPKA